ncbi:hypothetical protein [Massilia rubra]|uniref:Uncharacterized protein n=1 Tax=Massilia rubra TaxID=2607910 RepID=A0ABX0LPX5_9BURK|nr:hypothetical protein [Massilia rubra]NHZ34743.1 hypothetical protein [Massilia rubra]
MMAISAKGKRRISVNERVYLWRMFEHYDQSWFDGVQVSVAAVDQALFVRYGLHQPDDSRTAVISRGRGAPDVRTACPRFEGEDRVLTPQGVRDLIDWGLAVAL